MSGRADLAAAVAQGLLAHGWPTNDDTEAADLGHARDRRRQALAAHVWQVVDAVMQHPAAADAYDDDAPMLTGTSTLPYLAESLAAQEAMGQNLTRMLQALAHVGPKRTPAPAAPAVDPIHDLEPDEWRLIGRWLGVPLAPDDVLSYRREQDATASLRRKVRDVLERLNGSDLGSR